MTLRCRGWYALAISLLVVGPALGQDVEDRDRWVGGEDLWTNVDAWVDSTDSPSGAPSPVSADRWALVQDGNVIVDCEGTCCGRILESPRGTGGFGYDPLFELAEYHKTFGELGASVKSILSHRARAIRQFVPRLIRLQTRGADADARAKK